MDEARSYADPVFDEVARREAAEIRAKLKAERLAAEAASPAGQKRAINKILRMQRLRQLQLKRVMSRK